MRGRFAVVVSVAVLVAAVWCVGLAGSASAADAPWWRISSRMVPSRIAPGGEGTLVLLAMNLGDVQTSGAFTFKDTLPAGLSLQGVSFFTRPSLAVEHEAPNDSEHDDFGPSGPHGGLGYCEVSGGSVSCSSESASLGAKDEFLLQPVFPYDFIELQLKVRDEGEAAGALNTAEVSGGGAGAVRSTRTVPVGEGPILFGLEDFSLVPEEEGGVADTRAGSHPYQLTTSLTFERSSPATLNPVAGMPRNLHFKLPPGVIGNATVLPTCSEQDFAHVDKNGTTNDCKADTVVGVAVITASTFPHREETFTVPVFNLPPSPGEPARFGFEIIKNPVILDTAVRSGAGEDYGVTVNVNNITQVVNFMAETVTFWGTPRDPAHNEARGWGCLLGGHYDRLAKKENEQLVLEGKSPESELVCEGSNEAHPTAFLTMPTNCGSSFAPVVEGDAWPTSAAPSGLAFPPASYQLQDGAGDPLSLTGCNRLAFSPEVSVAPSAQSASSPSGLDFNLNFDDEGLVDENGVAQSQLRDVSVALPEGLTINPSAGVGLQGCTEAEYARETVESEPGAGCPNSSKLGTVEIETPLLTQKVKGSIYIAQPYENPSGSLVALYVVAKNPVLGILIKLAGKVTPNPVTGQLVTAFTNNPQLPFNHFNFHFREGQQAPLITPPLCGTYTTSALLAPWSDPTAPLTDTSSFSIGQGPEGGPCPSGGAPPFGPGIEAGTVNNAAGSFSPFYLHLTRTDGQGEITGFSTVLAPGMTGILTGIPFCPEQDIALARTKTGRQEEAEPSCPAASQLGHSLVGTGVGAVLAYTPGRVYLAGPYGGDPFSLVSVTSAVVGPFDLGTVVIRFGLRIDPHTAQVSVDPSASEPIPHIIDGIVTHVRDIRVYIDRPNFTLNPTSCEPMSVSSTLSSNWGQSVTVASPFQAASCASLKFDPKFEVFTSGKNSKADGASLTVRLTEPVGSLGTQANIARVKVELPQQLPSRLTTLQKACTAAQFDANPAGCPAASIIGHAVVHTPILPVPLEGPAYFVSNGGEAFPNLIIVLQGYGVTVDLVGDTFISKAGITSSTFKTVPDTPFSTFELTLPQGPDSALTANVPVKASYSLCGQKLTMPTQFLAQNGMTLNQTTQVVVQGCAAATKALTRAQKLTKALKACRKKHNKHKRQACERAARKKYAAAAKKAKKSKR